MLEPSLAEAKVGEKYQFERNGYFCVDLEFRPRQTRLQPHRHPQGHLGQDRKETGLRTKQNPLSPPRTLLRGAGGGKYFIFPFFVFLRVLRVKFFF